MWRAICYIAQDDKKTGLTYHKAFLKLIGLFLWEKSWWQHLYSFWPIITNLSVATTVLIFAIEAFETHTPESFLEFVKSVILLFTFYFAPLKLILVRYFGIGKKIRDAIDYLESQDLTGGEDTSQFERTVVKLFTGTISTTAVGWSLFNAIHEGDFFPARWPFAPLKPNYIIVPFVYIEKLLCTFYCIATHGTLDTLFPMMVTYIAYQGTKLEALLKSLGSNRQNNEEILKKAIEQHTIMIESMRRVRSAYELLFTMEVVYAILHSCVIAFSALNVNNVGFVMTGLVPMLFSAYGQLFVFCQAGEKANTIMREITFKVYDNEWYKCNLKVKKSLALMLLASNKTNEMEGVGPFVASFSTYLHSVQESFSYFVALRTISSKY